MLDPATVPSCSFCNRGPWTAFKLIQGERGVICARCVTECASLLAEEMAKALPDRPLITSMEKENDAI